MALFVIVLCLLSERYLVHQSALYRFYWFYKLQNRLLSAIPNKSSSFIHWLKLFYPIFIIAIITWLVLYIFGHWLFGLFGLAFNIIIFYQCIGPQNPFYPNTDTSSTDSQVEHVGDYLADVNRQLFTPIFWYVLLGPIGVLVYRLITLSISSDQTRSQALLLSQVLEWIPARIISFLYAAAGDFQKSFNSLKSFFVSDVGQNHKLLKTCGLNSLGYDFKDDSLLPQAEGLVERTTILYMVIIALFCIATWF